MFNKNNLSFITFCYALSLLLQPVYAQTSCKLGGAYFKSYITDTKNIAVAPLHWKPQQYIAAALITGGIIALTQYDESISSWVQQNKTDATGEITKFLKPLGNDLVVLGGSAGIYALGALTHQEKTSCIGLQNFKAALISSAFIFGIKHLTHRARPYMYLGSKEWEMWSNDWEYTSFPSGHSTFAFTTATTFTSISNKKIVPIIAYTLAASVALSRIHDNRHWPSDVLAGAAIGTAFSLTINRSFK